MFGMNMGMSPQQGAMMGGMMGMGMGAMMGMGSMGGMMGMGGMGGMMGMGMMQMFMQMQMMQMQQQMNQMLGQYMTQMQRGGQMPMGTQMGGMMGMQGYPFNFGSTFPNMSGYPPVNMCTIQGGTPMGNSIARDAAASAHGPGGRCLAYVSNCLGRHGVSVHGESAYMAANQLANNRHFSEIHGLRNDQLKKLPPGAVVVWDRGAGHPHGHISVALGNGHEASDVLRNQITNYGTQFRVFLPNDGQRAQA